jgi:hypothetical protein
VTARLESGLWVSALLRRAMTRGIMTTVLNRGDPQSGAITLACRGRDGRTRILAALTQADGSRAWMTSARLEDDQAVSEWLERQRQRDSDIWSLEVETDSPQTLLDEDILPE